LTQPQSETESRRQSEHAVHRL